MTAPLLPGKVRNIDADSHCPFSTEGAYNPVVIQGRAELILDMDARRAMVAAMNKKYDGEIGEEFLAPEVNCLFAVRAFKALGLRHDDFNGSPTRWTFGQTGQER